MSKIQEKETGLFNNLSSSEIVDELDSRLRDLEKNISVAREFIKLADESYSELRHKWNLLQEEARNQSQTTTSKKESVVKNITEISTVKTRHTKNRAKALDEGTGFEPATSDDTLSLESSSHKTKTTKTSGKEANSDSGTYNPDDEKTTRKDQGGNRKHKKSSGRSSKSSHL